MTRVQRRKAAKIRNAAYWTIEILVLLALGYVITLLYGTTH